MKQVILSFLINPLLTVEMLSITFFPLSDYTLKSLWHLNCIWWLELSETWIASLCLCCSFTELKGGSSMRYCGMWIGYGLQMELWSVFSWQACSCLDGVTTVRPGTAGEARITASLCRWSQVTVEEVMTTTAYLDLFLRSISEPALLEIFLRFILLHQHENVHILDTLTSRINTPFRVRRAPQGRGLLTQNRFQEGLLLESNYEYSLVSPHPFFLSAITFWFWKSRTRSFFFFSVRSPSVREVALPALHRMFFSDCLG